MQQQPKKKHVWLKITGAVALVGLCMMIIASLFGGRVGTLYAEDGRLVFRNSRETLDLGAAPYWMGDINDLRLFNPLGETGYLYDYDYNYEYDYDYSGGDNKHHGNRSGAWSTVKDTTIDIDPGDFLELDIECGHVVIETGTKATLTVSGPVEANVYKENGGLTISDDRDFNGITSKQVDGETHFFKNGTDVTTWYTITLPERVGNIDVDLGLGTIAVSDVESENFKLQVSLGSATVQNITSGHVELKSELGSIEANGIATGGATLECEGGSIEFSATKELGYLNAECSLGSITAKLPRPGDYGYNIENEMGSITLDGHTRANPFDGSHAIESGEGPVFDLHCELGAIEVIFT